MIRSDICRKVSEVRVLKDISTEIRKGECVCVIGPSDQENPPS